MKQPNPNDWQERTNYRKHVLATPDSLGENRLVQIVEIPPGNHVAPHYHNQTQEIFYILQAGGELTIDGTTIAPADGELVVCEPGDVHSVTNTSDTVFRILVFKTDLAEDDTVWLDDG